MEVIDSQALPPLFNSLLETGLRLVIVLDALYPRACNLNELVWFDYLVVHTGDFNGPVSLHPELPSQAGELLVRRRLIEKSARLMHRYHFVDIIQDANGVSFVASEESSSFVKLLETLYSETLKKRALWVSERFQSKSTDEIENLISEQVGRLTAQFQISNQDYRHQA
jgi:hypothetical protein